MIENLRHGDMENMHVMIDALLAKMQWTTDNGLLWTLSSTFFVFTFLSGLLFVDMGVLVSGMSYS